MKEFMLRFFGAAFAAMSFAAAAFAQGQVIYNAIPAPLAGNYPSQPFQAQQASEVGDRVQFAGSARSLLTVTHTMSSWACESGAWYTGDCTTASGATFNHPITLNIYNVGPDGAVGSLIHTVTQYFEIPYRPSANPACGDGRWRNAAGNCYNGYATNITFSLPGITVPNEVIYGIAYNTSNYGYEPIGTMPCTSTPQGCPYDSLNVAVQGAVSVGVNPSSTDAYFNTATAAWYCDGGAGGLNVFRLDAGCWTGYKPFLAKFTAANPPANADQCKNGGFETRTRANGSPFKNQGDCIQYVNTGN